MSITKQVRDFIESRLKHAQERNMAVINLPRYIVEELLKAAEGIKTFEEMGLTGAVGVSVTFDRSELTRLRAVEIAIGAELRIERSRRPPSNISNISEAIRVSDCRAMALAYMIAKLPS